MAKKSLYSVKFTSNFRFSKLGANFDEVLDDSTKEITDSVARNTKKNILTGGMRELKPSTIKRRQSGSSSFTGHSTRTTTETRPLLYTKRLYNSIKGTKDGLEIMDYGLEHQKGFITPEGALVPPREFITTEGKDKDALIKVEERIVKKMNRIMLKTSK